MRPDVSVVIPVYNSMPYLVECLDSVLKQTLDASRIEIIAVDDASDDGSAELLDQYAGRHPAMVVHHRETGSGGPSLPRNQALEQACGRYVFFMDADDVLGEEALERMVAMADRDESDIVLGKIIGLGRTSSVKAYQQSGKVDLFRSEVYRALSPQKLFRRSIIEENRLRFDEKIWWGEDQIFVTEAHLVSRGVSVVGDYDCYFLRFREDGGNITQRVRGVDEMVQHVEILMEMVADRVSDDHGRMRFLARHFRYLASNVLRGGITNDDAGYRSRLWERCRALYERYWAPEMHAEIGAYESLQIRLLGEGDLERSVELAHRAEDSTEAELVFDGGRAYRRYPFFRTAPAVPDHFYDVTDRLRLRASLVSSGWDGTTLRLEGEAWLTDVDLAGAGFTLVLRRRGDKHELRLAATTADSGARPAADSAPDTARTRWRATIDVPAAEDGAPLTTGVWDARLHASFHGVRRSLRLPATGGGALAPHAGRLLAMGPAGEVVPVVPYATTSGRLSLDVGGWLRPVEAGAAVTSVAWDGDRLLVTGAAWLTELPAGELSVTVALRRRAGETPAPRGQLARWNPFRALGGNPRSPGLVVTRGTPRDGGRSPASCPASADPEFFTVELDLGNARDESRLGGGVWDFWVTVESGSESREFRLPSDSGLTSEVLGRTRPSRRKAGASVTAYVTRGGYLAVDGQGKHFPVRSQLHLEAPRRRGKAGETEFPGRLGALPGENGVITVELLDARGTVMRELPVPFDGEPDEAVESVTSEPPAAEWPAFTLRVPTALLPPGGTARLRMTVEGAPGPVYGESVKLSDV